MCARYARHVVTRLTQAWTRKNEYDVIYLDIYCTGTYRVHTGNTVRYRYAFHISRYRYLANRANTVVFGRVSGLLVMFGIRKNTY